MPRKSITLDLPDDLYDQVCYVAEQHQRPIEHVLVESIRSLFVPPSPSTDLTTSLAALSNYTDEQLWAVVYQHQRLVWPQAQRLHELSAQTKRERLTANEQYELDYLLTLHDRAMLLRSEALRLLKNCGHDIAIYLEYRT